MRHRDIFEAAWEDPVLGLIITAAVLGLGIIIYGVTHAIRKRRELSRKNMGNHSGITDDENFGKRHNRDFKD